MYEDEDALVPNFNVELYSAAYDASSESLTDYWFEAIPDSAVSAITINEVCEPCAPGDAVCDDCSFAFDLSWFAVRTKVE